YLEYLEPNSQAMQIVLGYCENLCAYDTYQFTNYDRYEANVFSESEKAQQREKIFPEDLKKAYELGARLVRKANNHE
ncbi:MAG: flavodoxin family protein, partial [Synergistaceae bacterium]|nr:flavodoxin family protein [Synergistaceae bacterium]